MLLIFSGRHFDGIIKRKPLVAQRGKVEGKLGDRSVDDDKQWLGVFGENSLSFKFRNELNQPEFRLSLDVTKPHLLMFPNQVDWLRYKSFQLSLTISLAEINWNTQMKSKN